jgi:adenylate cyclase
MRRFLERFAVRTLRLEILTIFLALISFSSIVIVSFTYIQDTKAFDAIFHRSMHRLNNVIVDRTSCLLAEFRRVPEFIRGFVKQQPHLTVHNQELIDYFLNMMTQQKNLTTLFMGMPNGDALVIDNLSVTDHPNWFSSSELAPEGTKFTYLLVDHSKPEGERETWNYVSKDLRVIATHKKPLEYDPRMRPWYQGAEKSGKLFWTDLYLYALNGVKGISCSIPIYDSSGKLLSVVGTDISLYFLSKFLSAQKIGKEGYAYVCDAEGQIIVPPPGNQETQTLVSSAFAYLKRVPGDSEFYLDFQNRKYLVSIHGFPLSATKNWNIILFDPRDDLFYDILSARKQIILISLGILLISGIFVVYFSKRISHPIVSLSKEVDRITNLDLDSNLRVYSIIKEVKMMDTSIAAMRSALRSFSHYVPKDIVLELIRKGQEITLGGEKKEITIFFSDIEEFTTVSEALSVDKLTPLLEEYFAVLSQTILAEKGTIDKYIGDGIMAFWGAPHPLSDHADQACLSALRCQSLLKTLNDKRIQNNLPPFFTRIGINTGVALVGNLGTMERMNYTAIGDAVNLASRLQNINKMYRTKIIIGEETKAKLSANFLVRPLDIVEVRGKKNKTKIFELIGTLSGDPETQATPAQIELSKLFTEAVDAFEQGDLEAAKAKFTAIYEKFPNDEPAQFYLKRME